jgi:hypothetical protein
MGTFCFKKKKYNKRMIGKGETKQNKNLLENGNKKPRVVCLCVYMWSSSVMLFGTLQRATKKNSSPMIPIESCYYYRPWTALNRPSRSFTKNLSLSFIVKFNFTERKKKSLLLIIIIRHVLYP